jgi:hypothetical protein
MLTVALALVSCPSPVAILLFQLSFERIGCLQDRATDTTISDAPDSSLLLRPPASTRPLWRYCDAVRL